MMKQIVIGILILMVVKSQSDGNPWKWDRQRRCDNEDYEPQCGLCEGVGGQVWSDKVSDIKIAKCTPIALPSELPEEVQKDYPVIPNQFTQNGHFEILITDKKNLLCIGGNPGPDSTKEHCYSRQTGSFIYDFDNKRLKMDLNVYGSVFNQSSSITHSGNNMWISNDLGVTKQCICLKVMVGPLIPDFMKEDSRFVGREMLWIEFLEEEKLVDHWVKGPHHIWKDVETNRILRMWQPWNGLEVWHPNSWDFSDNSHHFQLPPKECIESWFRTKCDHNGYPQQTSLLL